MLIDMILDRAHDIYYNAKSFYFDALAHKQDEVTRAMDYGTETDVRKALCDYIDRNGYNSAIRAYVESVDWLTDCYASNAYADCLTRIERAKTFEDLNETVEEISDREDITHREYAALYSITLIRLSALE